MRVLLVQSWLGGMEPPVYPIGLACIAAALPEHDVRLFDPNVQGDPEDPYALLDDLVHEWKPDVIGVSLRNIDSTNKRLVVYYYSYFQELVRYLAAMTSVPIIVGGAGFSLFAERVMRENPEIYAGIYLEGEHTTALLLQHLDDPATIPGLYYRHDEQILFTGVPEKLDLSRSPNLFCSAPGLGNYPLPRNGPEPIGIESKRGCALHCIYCPYGFLNGREYRLISPSDVVDRIETLAIHHGVNRFTFLDSVFNIPKSHAESICREIATRKLTIQWSAWFNEREMDEDFLKLCIAAGCTTFILSPDGIADSTLRTLGKSQRKKDIVRTWSILSKLAKSYPHFEVSYNFFKNPPGQTWAGFLYLLYFLFKAKVTLRNRVHFEVNSLRVEPHTKLHDIALKESVCTEKTDLLEPIYYTQRSTQLIEWFWNLILKALGK